MRLVPEDAGFPRAEGVVLLPGGKPRLRLVKISRVDYQLGYASLLEACDGADTRVHKPRISIQEIVHSTASNVRP